MSSIRLQHVRSVLFFVLFGWLVAGTGAPFSAFAQNSARFAAVGDFGDDSTEEKEVAELVKSWNPDFVITLGDDNYPDGAASTIDRNIGKYYHDFIFPYVGNYGAGASFNRFFPSLGNHDWHATGAKPYLDYFTLPGNERYYDFVRGTVHFYAIDSDASEPDGITETSVQGKWLKENLAAATEPWKIVYFHHPPYSSGRHGSSAKLQWHFKEWGATAVLSGHDHTYERLIVNDFPYFVNGLGGAERYSFDEIAPGSQARYNGDHGAMLVDAGNASITFQFINSAGELIDNYTLTTEPAGIAAPGNLRATTVSSSQINLAWADNSNNETGFAIERCQNAGCTDFTQIAEVGANVTAYSDSDLAQGVYAYRLRAVGDAENSAYSNVAAASASISFRLFSDDFDDGVIDLTKWERGLFSRNTEYLELQIPVLERNGRLEISPFSAVSGLNYNGYKSAASWNLTDSAAGVEVVQTADNKAATVFSVGSDDDNWFSFRAKGDALYLESRRNGNTSRSSIEYNETKHRFWRIRHDATADAVLFETSADGTSWTKRRSVARQIAITAVQVELIAGTSEEVNEPGTAVFDNFRFEPRQIP